VSFGASFHPRKEPPIQLRKIAAQMITNAAGVEGKVAFVVCHVPEMLNALQAGYYAAWHGEQRSAS
jgi:hypothetical protein